MSNQEDFSKRLSKGDDASKNLIIELLGEENTHGMDVDSMFHLTEKGWVVIEFLKCDTVRPYDSHPKRYWNKNWRKFVSLWKLTEALDGTLILVNYEDSRDQFLVIKVLDMDPTESGGITREKTKKMNLKEMTKWYQEVNRMAGGLW